MAQQTMRLYRLDSDGRLIPWDFTVEGNVIVKEEKAEGGYATPQEEALLPRATQMQLADFRARGIRYTIRDGRPHIVSVPPVELAINRFYNLREPCFFEGCEALRKQWVQFEEHAKSEDPGCDTRCADGKVKRQFSERLRPILLRLKNGNSRETEKIPASA